VFRAALILSTGRILGRYAVHSVKRGPVWGLLVSTLVSARNLRVDAPRRSGVGPIVEWTDKAHSLKSIGRRSNAGL